MFSYSANIWAFMNEMSSSIPLKIFQLRTCLTTAGTFPESQQTLTLMWVEKVTWYYGTYLKYIDILCNVNLNSYFGRIYGIITEIILNCTTNMLVNILSCKLKHCSESVFKHIASFLCPRFNISSCLLASCLCSQKLQNWNIII